MHNKILPKVYHFIDNLNIENIYHFNKNICIIYRNYDSKTSIEKLLSFKKYCNKFKLKFLISNEIDLAFKLKLDGVYLPSFNKKFYHKKFQHFKNFIIIGSAHSFKEIRIKEKQKVSRIFLSSLFKRNKNFLGINKFKIFTTYSNKKFIALGGLNKNNIKKLSLLNIKGFAGIDFFKKKGPK